jgi:ABC-2 type transport system ATP-binding protein
MSTLLIQSCEKKVRKRGLNMNAVLQVEDVSKSYKRNPVLRNVSFSIGRGEIVALLGQNGAGKTTLIKCMMGTIQSYRGSISVFGKNVLTFSDEMRQRCGFLVEPALIPYLSGYENLSILASIFGVKQSDVNALLEMVSLKSAASRKVSDYSYGMRQRLGLAQALLTNPEVLVLDEPTVGLDPAGRLIIVDKLLKLQKSGTTILLSTHELDVAQTLATRAILIAEGTITRDVAIDRERYLQIVTGGIEPQVVCDLSNRFDVRLEDSNTIARISVGNMYAVLSELQAHNVSINDISEDKTTELGRYFSGGAM